MHKILTATLAAGAMAAGVAQAATTITAQFQVTATVQATCSVTTAPLAFSVYIPGQGASTGSTNVAVKCTKGTAFTVALNKGTTAGGAIGQRLMASGANTLDYNLFTTQTAPFTIFGDGTAGSATVAGTGSGVATTVNVPVWGQLPDSTVNQGAPPATNYADTITVSLTY